MADSDKIEIEINRKIASYSEDRPTKDAYVDRRFGAGVFDMRSLPFDSNVAGVEGHANILDNLPGGDPMVYGGGMGRLLDALVSHDDRRLGFPTSHTTPEALPALLSSFSSWRPPRFQIRSFSLNKIMTGIPHFLRPRCLRSFCFDRGCKICPGRA